MKRILRGLLAFIGALVAVVFLGALGAAYVLADPAPTSDLTRVAVTTDNLQGWSFAADATATVKLKDTLRVKTDGNPPDDKVVATRDANYPLAGVGDPTLDFTTVSGTAVPAMQLTIRLSEVSPPLVLTYQPTLQLWATNVDLKAGHTDQLKTLDTLYAIATANPNSLVTKIGFTVSNWNGSINSMTIRGEQFVFGNPPPSPRVVTATEPVLRYVDPNTKAVIPQISGVQYFLDGIPFAPGEYTIVGSVEATAAAIPGYQLNGVAEWPLAQIQPPAPPVVVQQQEPQPSDTSGDQEFTADPVVSEDGGNTFDFDPSEFGIQDYSQVYGSSGGPFFPDYTNIDFGAQGDVDLADPNSGDPTVDPNQVADPSISGQPGDEDNSPSTVSPAPDSSSNAQAVSSSKSLGAGNTIVWCTLIVAAAVVLIHLINRLTRRPQAG